MAEYLRRVQCSTCGGGGTIECPECMGSGLIVGVGTCGMCYGMKEITCPACDGTGEESIEYRED
jgi:DnaJ-class molecular chaperone